MIPPEVTAKLAEFRAKQQAGTITIEELREAVQMMRGTRTAAQYASSSSAGKKAGAAAKANINSDDLLAQLDGL